MATAYAIGVWRLLHGSRAGTWGPPLLAVVGVGLVVAGVVLPDPQNGFPPGVPTPATPTSHSLAHNMSFLVIFGVLVVAAAIFARRDFGAGRPGWAVYSIVTAAAFLPVFSWMAHTRFAPSIGYLFQYLMILHGFLWHALLARRLLREARRTRLASPER